LPRRFVLDGEIVISDLHQIAIVHLNAALDLLSVQANSVVAAQILHHHGTFLPK
jgi:hypothetical protein